MKRIKTRALALLLSCCLVTIGTVGSYQTAQAAEIVAGGTIVGTLEEILLSFGIFLLPSAMTDQAQSSDWWYSEDGNAALKPYYDDLASEYEKERFKVINGGGGDPQPSPTPVPEQKPEIQPTPVPEVKPGDIPTFDELVAPALAGGAISWASGAWDTMAKAVSNLWDKICGVAHPELDDEELTAVALSLASKHQNYPYYFYCVNQEKKTKRYILVFADKFSYCRRYTDGTYGFMTGNHVNYGKINNEQFGEPYYCNNSYSGQSDGFTYLSTSGSINQSTLYWSTNAPIFDVNTNDALNWYNSQVANADKYVKENIWVHPDLQNTYQNNGKFEYPQEAPQPLQYPSAENLADLAKKLNPEINPDYSPEIAPNYVQELIQKLQQNPSVNPDPNPNPNPNPNPDPGTNPHPTLKPSPTDTPDQPESPEDEVKPYTVDLTKVFPFCIPFDLIHLFKVLDAEPEAPVFKIPIELQVDNPFNGKSIVDYKDTIVINLSDYEQPVKVIRVFEVIFFLIGLMLITRSHMIKG